MSERTFGLPGINYHDESSKADEVAQRVGYGCFALLTVISAWRDSFPKRPTCIMCQWDVVSLFTHDAQGHSLSSGRRRTAAS